MPYEDNAKSIVIRRSLDDIPTASIQFAADPSLSIDDIVKVSLGWDGATSARFYGIVNQISKPKLMSTAQPISIGLVSAFSKLKAKPINSEPFGDGTTGATAMEKCITQYGGMPSAWVETPLEDSSVTFNDLIIRDLSVLEGLRKVAQACQVELFTNKDGKLSTAAYVDFDSYTPDHTIVQCRDLRVLETARDLDTVVRVRGGHTPIESSTLYQRTWNKIFDGTVKWWREIILLSGVTNPADLTVVVTGDIEPTVEILDVRGQIVELEFTLVGGATGAKSYTITVTGYDIGKPQIDSPSYILGNESDLNRIEAVRSDAILVSSHGVKEVVVDNKHIKTTAIAEAVGDRILAVEAASEEQVVVSMPFDSNIDLNEVIRFDEVIGRYYDVWVRELTETYSENPLRLTQQVRGFLIGEGNS